MSDDDLFPSEDTTSSRNSELLGSLFGTTTQPKREKKSLEDLFSSSKLATSQPATTKKRPTVTFQDPVVSNPRETRTEPRATVQPAAPPPSTDLLDSIFSGSGGTRRSRQSTPPNVPPPVQQAKPRSADVLETAQPPPVAKSAPETSSISQTEVENLRRELSALKYEKTEDQETIRELRAENKRLQDDHKREVDNLNRKHRSELESLESKHANELKNVQNTSQTQSEILENIKSYQTVLANLQTKLDDIHDSSVNVQEQIKIIKEEHTESEKIIEFANNQIADSRDKLHSELEDWEHKRENGMIFLEKELQKLSKLYNEDIVNGRKWIQNERDKLFAEKRAFQEEKMKVVEDIERFKEQIEETKSEFLQKEHDLLVRVVNERTLLQQRERQFEIEKNADIMRIRREAEELEVCFTQIQNAMLAVEQIRKEYETKNKNLILNFEIISKYLPPHIRKQLMLI